MSVYPGVPLSQETFKRYMKWVFESALLPRGKEHFKDKEAVNNLLQKTQAAITIVRQNIETGAVGPTQARCLAYASLCYISSKILARAMRRLVHEHSRGRLTETETHILVTDIVEIQRELQYMWTYYL